MISVILPVHNGSSTILKTLQCLFSQSRLPEELLIIDDRSIDDSIKKAEAFLKIQAKKIKCRIIRHSQQKGLAFSYNEGIKAAKGKLIVTLHQDVILKKDSLEKLIAPLKNKNVVASYHSVIHPFEIWNQYNFWEKVYFARLVGKRFSGLDGKFDCFKKEALQKIGFFDEKRFRTAGEDGDVFFKLQQIGQVVLSKAEIIHLHKIDTQFGLREIIYKQAQYSEVQGVLLRWGRIRTIKGFLRAFFKEILLGAIFFPYLRVLGLFLVAIYVFFYSKIIYLKEYKNPRFLLVPFLNFFLLFVSLFYSFKGFIYGKQKI